MTTPTPEKFKVDWQPDYQFAPPSPDAPRTAAQFLARAGELMDSRGQTYDQPDGERSMGKAVAAFNALTSMSLTEAEGWLLMQLVKDARQWSTGRYHPDSAEDGVAYAALKAEALAAEGEHG